MKTKSMHKKNEELTRPGNQKDMHLQPVTIREDYKGSGKLAGKIALITGGDSGIGRAIAVHFAREGAAIAIAYWKEDGDAKVTQHLVEQEGQKCIRLKGDMRKKETCESWIAKTQAVYGNINILVNNAATQFTEDSVADISWEHLNQTFDTNCIAMIYLTKLVVPHLVAGDRIINTTSVTSYKGTDTLVDYSATKGAITSFTRALSGQLAQKGILVNAVAPGPVWTPLIPATMEHLENFGEYVPLGRCGQPADLGPAYVYLASADSSWVTGQVIHVNGGLVVGG